MPWVWVWNVSDIIYCYILTYSNSILQKFFNQNYHFDAEAVLVQLNGCQLCNYLYTGIYLSVLDSKPCAC